MVAQLLRLSVLEFAGRFRGGAWAVAGAIAAVIGALVLGILGFWLAASLGGLPDPGLAHRFAVVGGAILLLGCFVAPLLRGHEDPADPRRFAAFDLRLRTLAAGTALASVVGLPALALAITLAGFVAGTAGPGTGPFAVAAAVVAFATCILAARLGAGCGSLLAASARLRDWLAAGGVLVALLATASVLATALATPLGLPGLGAAVADILAVTPLGAVWALPGTAADGDWGRFALQSAIALATLGAAWVAWELVVARMLVTPGRTAAPRPASGLGWFGVLSASPAGVVAARSLSYLGRDPRYWVSLAIIPVAPLLLLVPLELAGVPASLLVFLPVPVMCLLLGWSVHNDTANDHTAVWLHVVSGMRGSADRLGRAVPILILGLLVIAIGCPLSAVVLDQPAAYPAVVGISIALLLGGLGVGSVVSAVQQYPSAKPGDGAFEQPQASGGAAGAVQTITLLLTIGVAAAPIVLTFIGYTSEVHRWYFAALFTGVSTGLFVFVAGILIGGMVFEHRGPEILQAALRA